MKKSLFAISIFCGFLLQSTQAQQAGEVMPSINTKNVPVVIESQPPLVKAKVSAQEQAIQLTDLSIQTKIYGNIATTTYDMTFYNPNDRVLEGELEFPLFGNQSVVGYSLDINGHQREGVVTEKQLARQAFEEKVKQGIDPGIIEKTAGNNYKTRIYPLPPKQTRRVTITYEEVLNRQQGRYKYDLALNYSQPIKNFSYEVKILELNKQPVFIEALSGLSFQSEGESGYFAKLSKTQFTPNQNIKISVPVRDDVQQFYEQHNGGLYTLINVPFDKEFLEEIVKVKPKNVAIVWDSSLSAGQAGRDIEKEAGLIEKYLAYLNLNADVYTFDTVFEKKGAYGAEKIRQALVSLPTISGSDFSVLDANVLNGYDEVIIVSDGIGNLGNKHIKGELKSRVIAVNSAAQSNERYLEYLSDGQLLNLSKLSLDKALNALQVEPIVVSEIFYDINAVKEVYHSNLQTGAHGLSLMAKLSQPQTTVRVVLKKGDRTFERSVTLNALNKQNTKGIARLFGTEKIRSLEIDLDKNRNDIVDVAKQFTIVTDYTSLIVLDDVNDYVRYGIVPPPELKEAYDAIVQKQMDDKKAARSQRLAILKLTFDEMKHWYSTQYSAKKLKQKATIAPYTSPALTVAEQASPSIIEAEREPDSVQGAIYDTTKDEQLMISNAAVGSAHRDRLLRNEAPRGDVMAIADSSGNVSSKVTTDTEQSVAEVKKITIELKAWTPNAAYLKEISSAQKADQKKVYFELQKQYSDQPAFYMDMADFFALQGDKAFATRIVLSIADLNLEDIELLRALGYKLVELGHYDYAIEVFEKLVDLRGEDQQSYRDLGLIYEKTGHKQKALEKLYYALTGDFTNTHPGVDQTLLMELNHLIALNPDLDTSRVDKGLIQAMPVDLRIVIDWNIDNTDIDLWVTDPHGFKVYYSNPLSPSGGAITRDVTTGFGPENFAQKKAIPGTYIIQVQQYGSSSQKVRVHGAAMVKATVFTNYGNKNEKSEEMMVRLDQNKDVVDIGKFKY